MAEGLRREAKPTMGMTIFNRGAASRPLRMRSVTVTWLAVALVAGCGSPGRTSGDGGGGGREDAGGGTGDAGIDPAPDCDGVALESDGVLDLDVGAVTLEGDVTLDGEPLPSATGSRGSLELVRERTGSVLSVDLGTSGPASYRAMLTPGTYAARYRPAPSSCSTASGFPMPCNGGVLIDEVEVRDDGVLDVDIPAVHVEGRVTLDGEPLPEGTSSRGAILFRDADASVGGESGEGDGATTGARVDLGASASGDYAVTLLPGHYDVLYGGRIGSCGEAATSTPAMPCNGGELRSGVELQDDGVLDLDVPAVRLEGRVTLDGSPLPEASGSRGSLQLRGDDGMPAVVDLGVSEPQTYAVTLLPGSYDVAFEPSPSSCDGRSPTAMPCNGGVLQSDVAVDDDGVLDVDVPAVRLEGAVTLNGAPLPDASSSRGLLTVQLGEGTPASVDLGTTGSFDYALTLLPGEHEVSYAPVRGFGEGCAGPMPCNGGVLRSGVSVDEDGVLDVDVPAVHLEGDVTLEGEPLPDMARDRGDLVFSRDEGSAAHVDLGSAGPMSYAVTLLPDGYDVSLDVQPGACTGASTDPVPCGGGVLRSDVAVEEDGVLDVDIPAVHVEGQVTLGGEPAPSEELTLRFVSVEDGPAVAVGPFTAGSGYGVTLVPGRYAVGYAGDGRDCDRASPAWPCLDAYLRGCD